MSVAYLDTHVVVWLYSGDLSRFSVDAMATKDDSDLLISPAVLLELEYLKEIGRIKPHARRIVGTLSGQVGLTVCELPFERVVEAALDRSSRGAAGGKVLIPRQKGGGPGSRFWLQVE